jgi:hypothetical protein
MKMFKVRNLYRHDSTLDIDLYVVGITSTKSLFVRYWNRHSKFFQGRDEIVTIKEKDYHHWKQVDDISDKEK